MDLSHRLALHLDDQSLPMVEVPRSMLYNKMDAYMDVLSSSYGRNLVMEYVVLLYLLCLPMLS